MPKMSDGYRGSHHGDTLQVAKTDNCFCRIFDTIWSQLTNVDQIQREYGGSNCYNFLTKNASMKRDRKARVQMNQT